MFISQTVTHTVHYLQADTSDWTNIIPTMEQKDNMFTFTFHSLTPGTEYEVIIQTRNREGWADPPNIFKFKTRDGGTFSSSSHYLYIFYIFTFQPASCSTLSREECSSAIPVSYSQEWGCYMGWSWVWGRGGGHSYKGGVWCNL